MSITQACAWLGVPRSTYYRWKARNKDMNEYNIVKRILELCNQYKFRYGYRKITALLRLEQQINHKRVQRIMQREQLQCRVKVKKRKTAEQPAQIAKASDGYCSTIKLRKHSYIDDFKRVVLSIISSTYKTLSLYW
ncbi:IS3 family transposase [Paenibacillus sp. IHBB 10380]|uniref:IS3 family transposase n=1 Tax=Paenibacillus sp. IHBB 10380 TaxID=1566358 RepID=UPI000697CF02|nr:IS3 family transposase [Paenibacillus sp. IHBB 10380]